MTIRLACLTFCLAFLNRSALAELHPLLAIPGEVAYESDFSESGPIVKTEWKRNQGTQWIVEEGVLRGQQSAPEFQAKKKDHRGLEPRLSCPATPPEFVAQFSVRFREGKATAIAPFIEFGHHIARVRFREDGIDLVADYETMQVAAAADYNWESGKWYHCLAELKGDEFVIQFQDGPTLYARHPCFTQPAPSGGIGLGLAGPRGGFAELDDVTLWTVKGEQKRWPRTRAALPVYEPVKLKEKKVKR
jgi:hypothetical protein